MQVTRDEVAARALGTPLADSNAPEAKLLSQPERVLRLLAGSVPVPSVVEIFPTNFCNYHCPHCRCRGQHGSPGEYMDLGTLGSLLAELEGRGVAALELSGGGESLEHPGLDGILGLIKGHKMRFATITNGYRFVREPRLLTQALETMDWIRFSIDGFTEDSYRRVHGVKEASYAALKGMIAGIPRSGGIPVVGAKVLISRLNAGDVPLVLEEARAMGIDYLQYKFLSFPSHLVLPAEEQARITGELRPQLAGVRGPMQVQLMDAYAGANDPTEKCRMTFLHPVVDWDGTIYLCAFFEHRKLAHAIGNIRDGGFFAHWDAQKHWDTFDAIDPANCVPNCPMKRYNPTVEWLAAHGAPDPATVQRIRETYPMFRYV